MWFYKSAFFKEVFYCTDSKEFLITKAGHWSCFWILTLLIWPLSVSVQEAQPINTVILPLYPSSSLMSPDTPPTGWPKLQQLPNENVNTVCSLWFSGQWVPGISYLSYVTLFLTAFTWKQWQHFWAMGDNKKANVQLEKKSSTLRKSLFSIT